MTVRWILAAATGLAVAGMIGLLGWWLSPVAPELSAVVFAACALPIGVVLGWLIFVAPKTIPAQPHAEESVERVWLSHAMAGTATDLVFVIGLGLTAVSITRAELPTQFVLVVLLIVAFASCVVRYGTVRLKVGRE